MNNLIPKLELNSYFDNDILFSQGDQANEIFFIFQGGILLYIDITDFVDLKGHIKPDEGFNLPLAMFNSGSYFGDSDVMHKKNGYRSQTAICQDDCQMYVINYENLMGTLDLFPDYKQQMERIAAEKTNYYYILMDEMKRKYKKGSDIEAMIEHKGDDEWC